LTSSFSPIDIDVWNATLKPSTTISRPGDGREPLPSHTAPTAGLLANNPSDLSPRLHAGSRLNDSKTHNRQTSIVHGIQHSRNGSYASTSSSPLSPQIIAAAGGERSNASNMGDSHFASTMSSMATGTSFSSNTTLVPERATTATENSNHNLTQKRVERMHSGRSRREHGHHPSHSRHHHKEEVKTVGEYALHVLFTSVSPPPCTRCKRPNKILSSLPKPKRRSPNV